MRREEALIWLAIAAFAIGGGFGLSRFQRYLSEDWRQVADCRATHWVCEAQVSGRSRLALGSEPPSFGGRARACDEFTAYETALRRAMFDCSMSGTIVGGSCREQRTDCAIPGQER